MERLSEVERAERGVATALERVPNVGWGEAADAVEARILGRDEEAVTDEGRAFVDALEELSPGVLSEPHLLGWIHQHLGTGARNEAFRAHTKSEAKHSDSIVATQIYTPRWVADLLVEQAMAGYPEATVADPACGGGQFLLAAFDRMVSNGTEPIAALGRLWGGDLDPTAVDAARRSLALMAYRAGASFDGARAVAMEQVVMADALDFTGPFDVVVTNPPYMGHRSMPDALRERLKTSFRPFHLDLATAVTARCAAACVHSFAILSQQSIWFLKRFEEARAELLDEFELDLFAHFGPHLFDVLSGEKASVVGYVMHRETARESATFHDLRDLADAETMRSAVVSGERRSERDVTRVTSLPGAPMAHDLPARLVDAFADSDPLGERFDVPGSQNKTGRNRRYVRQIDEVDPAEVASLDAPNSDGERWRFYSKGGRYAPWWGNWDNVVDWSDEARRFYDENRTSNLLDDAWIDRVGLVYTDFGGRTFNARWKPATALFDMAGPAIFHPEDDEKELAALLVYLNSEPGRALLNALNPTLHYQVREVRLLPLPAFEENLDEAAALGRELVERTRRAVETGDGGEAAKIRELERRANRLVCAAFGVEPSAELPVHSKLQ